MGTAYHEVCHAFAAAAHALPVPRVVLSRNWRGRPSGVCTITGPTLDDDDQWALDAYAVFLHAGEAAESMYLAGQGIARAADYAANGAQAGRAGGARFRPVGPVTDDEAWDPAVDVAITYWDEIGDAADYLVRTG